MAIPDKVKAKKFRKTEKYKKYIFEYHNNPEVIDRIKDYVAKNKEKIREYQKKYRESNKEKAREYNKKYNSLQSNRIKRSFKLRESRYKRLSATINTDITSEWLKCLWEETTHCILCGKQLENNSKYPDGRELDHIIPISVGGKHIKSNVRYICSKCNRCRPKDGRDLE